MSNVAIKNTKKYGRGLYATRNFKKGEIIEVSPVVTLDKMDTKTICDTAINMYVFGWSKDCSAFALGNGSLFNHSKKSNVSYMNSFRTKEIVFTANKKIKRGQQLFIDYGYDPKYSIKITKENKERKLYLNTDKSVRNDTNPTLSAFLPGESELQMKSEYYRTTMKLIALKQDLLNLCGVDESFKAV